MFWQIKTDELTKIYPLAKLPDLAFAIESHLLTSDEAQKFIVSNLDNQSEQHIFDLAIETDEFQFTKTIIRYLDDTNENYQKKLWAYIFLS